MEWSKAWFEGATEGDRLSDATGELICVGVAPSSPPHRPAGGVPGARRMESQDPMDRHHDAASRVNEALHGSPPSTLRRFSASNRAASAAPGGGPTRGIFVKSMARRRKRGGNQLSDATVTQICVAAAPSPRPTALRAAVPAPAHGVPGSHGPHHDAAPIVNEALHGGPPRTIRRFSVSNRDALMAPGGGPTRGIFIKSMARRRNRGETG